MMGLEKKLENIDTNHAIELAPRVWWVGHVQEGDPFQCHVYLIEQGDQSILIDPGSKLTFANTLRKINEVIPFTSIKYFVCQHQDPDITGAIPLIEQLLCRDDAVVVTHWRTKMLLKHYGFAIPFWLIEDNDWQLELDDRTLSFCFTPYAHFPGAFTTFDPESGIMFSSDLFGGLTEEFSLFAEDEAYLECMKPFHQHYIPSNDILQYVLSEIEKYPMRMIAPQHGSIIPKHLIPYMIDGLKSLDCGLYLLLRGTTDFNKLAKFNETLKNITKTMTIYRDFREIAAALFKLIQGEISIKSLDFYVRDTDGDMLHFTEKNHYRGHAVTHVPEMVAQVFEAEDIPDTRDGNERYELKTIEVSGVVCESLLIPLVLPGKGAAQAVILISLESLDNDQEKIQRVVEQMHLPLQISIEREMIYRDMEKEREKIYQRSIRDPLTNLYTRIYMKDVVQKLFDQQDREKGANEIAIMVDIDHFKSINDTYGHSQGDAVLQGVASAILELCSSADIPIRLGGEEFVIFSQADCSNALTFAERLRQRIESIQWEGLSKDRRVTASFGVACREPKESLDTLITRADVALYRAKHSGRNRTCVYEEEQPNVK
ncbi:diguanylate cyclase [Photobacterium sp. SDRW27]|uniref:diguanylate cyclase n=1 Tax=Photobacterium obscurum TaxID=2829490 RepID=UPI002242E6A6|nr:diguanylate cyclase [Photobacterium obscurum]MCW8327671.1 diguanylate cyclase [Photobacterium obscurum]